MIEERKKSMSRYRDTQTKDWYITTTHLVIFILLLTVSLPFLLADFAVLIRLVGAVSLLALVFWHVRAFAYRCSSCQHKFKISLLRNITALHGIDGKGEWKYLECPQCGDWNRERVRVEV
jgi:amino acid permease